MVVVWAQSREFSFNTYFNFIKYFPVLLITSIAVAIIIVAPRSIASEELVDLPVSLSIGKLMGLFSVGTFVGVLLLE